jgi:hypothetical protein
MACVNVNNAHSHRNHCIAAAAAAAHLSESALGGELERQLVGVNAVSSTVGDEPDTNHM